MKSVKRYVANNLAYLDYYPLNPNSTLPSKGLAYQPRLETPIYVRGLRFKEFKELATIDNNTTSPNDFVQVLNIYKSCIDNDSLATIDDLFTEDLIMLSLWIQSFTIDNLDFTATFYCKDCRHSFSSSLDIERLQFNDFTSFTPTTIDTSLGKLSIFAETLKERQQYCLLPDNLQTIANEEALLIKTLNDTPLSIGERVEVCNALKRDDINKFLEATSQFKSGAIKTTRNCEKCNTTITSLVKLDLLKGLL